MPSPDSKNSAAADAIAADLFPFASQPIAVGPHTLRYVDEGPADFERTDAGDAKPTILCVHGNPTWSFYYRRVIERFAPHLRVVAVDHLGCGRSDKPSRDRFGYRLADHRDNLGELIDRLDLQRIVLLAHDWGGAIGLSAVHQRRDRLAGIVLLNTGAFPPPYLPRRIAACRWPVVGSWAVRHGNLFARAAVFMAMAKRRLNREARDGLLAPYDSWKHRVAIDAFVQDIPMCKSHPTYEVLARLERDLSDFADVPVELIWGMKDWCFRPECLRQLQAALPHARTHELAEVGHYVMEDAPEETLQILETYFKRNFPGWSGSDAAIPPVAVDEARQTASDRKRPLER